MNPLFFPPCRRFSLLPLFGGIMLLAAWPLLAAEEGPAAPVELGEEVYSFDFETEEIRGTIRLDGAYHGVTRLTDKKTGKQVIDERYSALNLFKLMSVNQIMGQPRRMERTIQVSPKNMEVYWAPSDGHKAEITARYEVSRPNAVDVTVTVRSKGAYLGYEVFMSSYFDKTLRPHVYLQSRGASPPELVVPMLNDVFRGTVLVFPRDTHAARRCVDGRWDRNEWDTPVVQMCPVRRYAHCLAFLTDPDMQLGVVLMLRPEDCYAISTRYFAEDDADRMTSYSAFDFSLFGDDLLPGTERSVKCRLALVQLDGDPFLPLEIYKTYLSKTRKRGRESFIGRQSTESPPIRQ